MRIKQKLSPERQTDRQMDEMADTDRQSVDTNSLDAKTKYRISVVPQTEGILSSESSAQPWLLCYVRACACVRVCVVVEEAVHEL